MIIVRAAHSRIAKVVLICVASVSLLCGCVPGPGPYPSSPPPGPAGHTQPPPRQPIAAVEAVQGPNVTVAGRPAYYNMPVYENEEVKTGPGSAATILFRGGGLLQMEENTDPVFTLISQTFCVLVQMFRGHAQLDSEGRCIEAATPESQAFINSKIDITVEGGLTTWKVLEGRIEVALRARPQEKIHIAAGQRVLVSKVRLERPVIMPQHELQELNRRFIQMRVAPKAPVRPRPESPMPPPPVRMEPPPRTEPTAPPLRLRMEPPPRTEPTAPPLR